MKRDAFSQYHPLTNFLFFLLAIGFSVVIQHPGYLAVSFLTAGSYYLLLNGKAGWKWILGCVPVFVLVAAINPLFNTRGERVLFWLFSRPYTLEALLHGMAVAAMLVNMLLWFGCYSAVLTSDKFICLFGSLIPALSLLLVMVLRMIPNLMSRARQISGARDAIGKGTGAESGGRGKISAGMRVLSAMTDWALEGSLVTADSMRSRGYGCGKRTSFLLYRLQGRDMAVICTMVVLGSAVLLAGGTGAAYTPEVMVDDITWGLVGYAALLLIPTILQIKEILVWNISVLKI